MAVTTYRSYDQNHNCIRFVCEHAGDGQFVYMPLNRKLAPVSRSRTLSTMCMGCWERLENGDEEEKRVNLPGEYPRGEGGPS
jgi:hypothetical protein